MNGMLSQMRRLMFESRDQPMVMNPVTTTIMEAGMNHRMERWVAPLLMMAATGLLVILAGCDTSSASSPTEASSTSLTQSDATKLATDLNLTSEQTTQLQSIFAKHQSQSPEDAWKIASELQSTLSDEAKQKLIALSEAP